MKKLPRLHLNGSHYDALTEKPRSWMLQYYAVGPRCVFQMTGSYYPVEGLEYDTEQDRLNDERGLPNEGAHTMMAWPSREDWKHAVYWVQGQEEAEEDEETDAHNVADVVVQLTFEFPKMA